MQHESSSAESDEVTGFPPLDASQQEVLQLNFGEHCAILGAPGSGKTHTLLSLYKNVIGRDGVSDNEALILGVNRLVAAQLRREVDRRVPDVSGAPRVRTSTSLALSVIASARRAQGDVPLRLLTGAMQDELVDDVVQRRFDTVGAHAALTRHVLATPLFRNQFRELLRILDDAQVSAASLTALGLANDRPEWVEVASLIDDYRVALNEQFPNHADSSSIHALASKLLAELPVSAQAKDTIGDAAALRVIIVDDAQELTESALVLLRAFAERGVTIWAFGDPDVSTGAFQGAAHRALSNLGGVLNSRSRKPLVLSQVYRSAQNIHAVIESFTQNIGTAGLGQQRRAHSVNPDEGLVRYAKFSTSGERAGAVAHLLRERHLGIVDDARERTVASAPQTSPHPVAWSDMAVICRTRSEARKLARQLAAAQVPTDIAAGGMVLAEHPLVKDLLRLTQAAFGWRELDAPTIESLLIGPVGGLDPLAVHRLQAALQLADARAGGNRTAQELLVQECLEQVADPLVDSRQGRALRALGSVFAAGVQSRNSGGDLSEVLWALWDASALAKPLERQALGAAGSNAELANQALDAVVALFFSVQRFEEQEIEVNRQQFIESILDSALPEDSLATGARRDAVTVTTPNGMIGRAVNLVILADLQDGIWPNVKPRGTLLHLDELTHALRGDAEAALPSRKDVLHDELRMLVQALSRASSEVLFTALQNDDTMPSTFFNAQAPAELAQISSKRLTLRGMVGSLRRHLTEHPGDVHAARQLAILAQHDVPGADPEQWFGMREPSSPHPLVDLSDPTATVSVSPSRLSAFETCPLNWAISRLGGESRVSAAAVGTLMHLAMELSEEPTFDAVMARVEGGWSLLQFDSAWEEKRTHQQVSQMAESLVAYLQDFSAKQGELSSAEAFFELDIEQARVRGFIDRVEVTPAGDGSAKKILIVDLKTQRTGPTAKELEEHPQLAMYQLAAQMGEVDLPEGELAGAALLLVHPKAIGRGKYRLAVQDPLTPAQRELLIQRVIDAAQGMSRDRFTANVEHHCTDPFAFGNCSLHVIRSVSHA